MDATSQKAKLWGIIIKKHPVKLTALLYLKQALLEEQYEICSDLIAIAKEFGARDAEIYSLLEDPRRQPA